VQARETHYYGDTDTWLYAALERYPIRGKRVLLMGESTATWAVPVPRLLWSGAQAVGLYHGRE
jgi:hypothetical protein